MLAKVNLKVINIKYSNLNLKKINLPEKASLKENKNQKLSISYDRNEIKTDQLLDCLRSQGIRIMDLSTEEASSVERSIILIPWDLKQSSNWSVLISFLS